MVLLLDCSVFMDLSWKFWYQTATNKRNQIAQKNEQDMKN